jgi:hypothetical protein
VLPIERNGRGVGHVFMTEIDSMIRNGWSVGPIGIMQRNGKSVGPVIDSESVVPVMKVNITSGKVYSIYFRVRERHQVHPVSAVSFWVEDITGLLAPAIVINF